MQIHFYALRRATLGLLLASLATLAQAQNSGSVTMTQSFTYTGRIVTWPVPTGITSLTIEARGAEGGAALGSNVSAGKGAIISARMDVTSGQALSILVGQQLSGKGTGGGGSFVVGPGSSTAPVPLVVAGGGGWCSSWWRFRYETWPTES